MEQAIKKENLIKLLNEKNETELIEMLKKAYKNKEKVPYYNLTEHKLLSKDNEIPMDETGFRFYDYTRKQRCYYYVSNIGRVLIIESEKEIKEEYKEDIFNFKHWFVPRDSYTLCLDIESFKQIIKENNIAELDGYRFNSSTPVYNMVGSAWLKDEYEKVKKEYGDIRIDLHHINGNNNDCSTQNLIYLPYNVHARAH